MGRLSNMKEKRLFCMNGLFGGLVREDESRAFLMITNSSEIIGKGFRGLN